jgi:hypothetical protein
MMIGENKWRARLESSGQMAEDSRKTYSKASNGVAIHFHCYQIALASRRVALKTS